MGKYSFKNDYSQGAHPSVLQAIYDHNAGQQSPYSDDEYCARARAKIQEQLQHPDANIHFVNGGTMANLLVISHCLKPYEAVISAQTGHIEVHETGAIEAVGHKIVEIPSDDGKLTPDSIKAVLEAHTDEHKVVPRMVYLSNSTELGTVYRLSELQAISELCKKSNLYLYMDGARLGQALKSRVSDLSLRDISALTDVFYIGGTKNGALLGEAVVFNNPNLNANFRYSMKQKGALMAKGRTFGLQFEALFSNDLYFELAGIANEYAYQMEACFNKNHYDFLVPVESNQLFPILPNELIERLMQEFEFYVWKKIDMQHSAVRIVCSWDTPKAEFEKFISLIL